MISIIYITKQNIMLIFVIYMSNLLKLALKCNIKHKLW